MGKSAKEPEDFSSKGILRPELRLGVVSSITASLVRVNLKDAGASSGEHFSGGRYGKGEVGEFVLIEGQQNLLMGRIVEVRLPERERHSIGQDYAGSSQLDAIGNIQLLGSISMNTLQISAGVDAYPRLGDRVYSAPHQFLALIPALMDSTGNDTEPLRLEIGSVNVAHESKVSITPGKLFGRHCAILGATGGGKSWTTARIIEESIKYNAKIILLDATGEYRGFSDSTIEHYHLADPVENAANSTPCNLPPTSFQESDFIAMFEPSGKVQGPKLKEAIRSLRLVSLEKSLANNKGVLVKANMLKKGIFDAENGIAKKLDDPKEPFNVRLLPSQIREECVHPAGNYGKYPTKWGDYDENSYNYCLSLLSRINVVLTSPAYKCVFGSNSDNKSIANAIDSFSKTNTRLMRICLSGILHEFSAREIIANVLGRYLLTKARNGDFKNTPVVVIVDEAHSFLGRHIGTEDTYARLDAFELIAKEGRKYGLNICLATQRPRDITEGVLSQMGTLIVHRLTNDRDREIVERACGDIDRSASAFLPNLKPGEVAIVGVDFPIPLTIQIEKPTVKPQSEGPNYQKHWRLPANKS
ncbi:MAG: ATP-binding protein [Nitrospinae bacterium]|nr:ATP-binding protein [Nitrospinota bacterium]MBF0634337.1 ATP-binding protein [Nitrospinota bacterium]